MKTLFNLALLASALLWANNSWSQDYKYQQFGPQLECRTGETRPAELGHTGLFTFDSHDASFAGQRLAFNLGQAHVWKDGVDLGRDWVRVTPIDGGAVILVKGIPAGTQLAWDYSGGVARRDGYGVIIDNRGIEISIGYNWSDIKSHNSRFKLKIPGVYDLDSKLSSANVRYLSSGSFSSETPALIEGEGLYCFHSYGGSIGYEEFIRQVNSNDVVIE